MGGQAPSLRLWSLGWEPGSKGLEMGSRRIRGTCSFRVWGAEHEGVGRPRSLGTPWAAGSGWGVSWVGLGGQWGCEHQPPDCLFSHLQEGRPRQKGGAPTHPRTVLPLASSLLRAACWAAVSRGQCCRFCSTWGPAATMLEASMSHTRTPRSSRSEALSLGWGPPCRIAGQHEPGPTAHHPAS